MLYTIVELRSSPSGRRGRTKHGTLDDDDSGHSCAQQPHGGTRAWRGAIGRGRGFLQTAHLKIYLGYILLQTADGKHTTSRALLIDVSCAHADTMLRFSGFSDLSSTGLAIRQRTPRRSARVREAANSGPGEDSLVLAARDWIDWSWSWVGVTSCIQLDRSARANVCCGWVVGGLKHQ